MRPIDLAERLERLGAGMRVALGAAVSGGGDSTALLHLLAAAGRRVHVLHVDHAMRPASAGDARHVAALATSLGMPWSVLRAPVPRRGSPEALARSVRYDALERAACELGLHSVATAHTADDQAETVLLRAIRGTGLRGLAGIAPVAGIFVRPLLDLRRNELRDWLAERGVAWLDDPANADPVYERSWLRSGVMPEILARRPAAVDALASLASRAREDGHALESIARERFDAMSTLARGLVDIAQPALDPPSSVATRVVRIALELAGARADSATIAMVSSLPDGGSAACGSGVVAVRTAAALRVTWPVPALVPVSLPPLGAIDLADWGVRVRVGRATEPWTWRCTLDADPRALTLRARMPGDRVVTRRGTRKVQDVLVDAKVPRHLRDGVPLLCVAGVPVAVVGLTAPPAAGSLTVDAEPLGASWWRQ